jgi:hypothetical protein
MPDASLIDIWILGAIWKHPESGTRRVLVSLSELVTPVKRNRSRFRSCEGSEGKERHARHALRTRLASPANENQLVTLATGSSFLFFFYTFTTMADGQNGASSSSFPAAPSAYGTMTDTQLRQAINHITSAANATYIAPAPRPADPKGANYQLTISFCCLH